MMNNTYIYKITNLINGKSYIGISNNPLIRFRSHKSIKSCTYISHAINKHGVENFSFDIIEECTSRQEALIKEMDYIKNLNTVRPRGYNISPGGDNPPHKSGKDHPKYGTKLTDQEIENLRNKNTGKKYSRESKLKKAKLSVDIIENIHILHKEAGTIKELAKRLNVGVDTVRNYINGSRLPEIIRKGGPFLKIKTSDTRTPDQKNQDRKNKISSSIQGEKNPGAKLKESTVHEICQAIKNKKAGIENITNRVIGERFGCSKETIEQISSKRQWRHISSNYF